MSSRAVFYLLMAVSLVVVSAWSEARGDGLAAAPPVDLFAARDGGAIDLKFIAKSDARGRILIENLTDAPIDVRIPDAFVGVPVLAQQFGGGGGGLGGGGGGGQAVGGGGGGIGGGGGGFGGGGGQFSIPPEDTARIDVPLLCLDHGKKVPSSSKPYELVPAEEHLGDRPAVVQMLAAYGRGDLQRGAAQAAVWHLNSDVSWEELAAKLDGTVRSLVRNPYFSRDEMRMAVAYAGEAVRRAALEADAPADESLSEEPAEESLGEPSSYLDDEGADEPTADGDDLEQPADAEADAEE